MLKPTGAVELTTVPARSPHRGVSHQRLTYTTNGEDTMMILFRFYLVSSSRENNHEESEAPRVAERR